MACAVFNVLCCVVCVVHFVFYHVCLLRRVLCCVCCVACVVCLCVVNCVALRVVRIAYSVF